MRNRNVIHHRQSTDVELFFSRRSNEMFNFDYFSREIIRKTTDAFLMMPSLFNVVQDQSAFEMRTIVDLPSSLFSHSTAMPKSSAPSLVSDDLSLVVKKTRHVAIIISTSISFLFFFSLSQFLGNETTDIKHKERTKMRNLSEIDILVRTQLERA
jgi:hypothetical protein